jgi:hypothetical protein
LRAARANPFVIPAQAGTHWSDARAAETWIPACAGMTVFGITVSRGKDTLTVSLPHGDNSFGGAESADRAGRIGEGAEIEFLDLVIVGFGRQ